MGHYWPDKQLNCRNSWQPTSALCTEKVGGDMTSDCADGKYDVHNIVSPVPILWEEWCI